MRPLSTPLVIWERERMGKLTQKEAMLAEKHAADIAWFMENAYQADTKVRLPERLIPKLILVAEGAGIDFKREILKASSWAMTHPEKKDYGRFFAGWIGRANAPKRKQVDWSDPI